MNGHKLISARNLDGKSFQYAVCAECYRASGSIEEEKAEKILPLTENLFASSDVEEFSCIYCNMEIVCRDDSDDRSEFFS
jgi:hypothetical protein